MLPHILHVYSMNLGYAKRLVRDLSEDQMCAQPHSLVMQQPEPQPTSRQLEMPPSQRQPVMAAPAPIAAQPLPTPTPATSSKPLYLPTVPHEVSALRDRALEDDYAWEIVEGGGTFSSTFDQEVSYRAPSSPGLVRLSVAVSQREVRCSAEALITVTDSLDAAIAPAVINTRGLPGYTFERAAGELWRSRFDAERNLIVVNNGHRDFVFATRSRALQLRYLVRLYIKELVLKNFTGLPAEQLAERMIELSLYVEEKLKPT